MNNYQKKQKSEIPKTKLNFNSPKKNYNNSKKKSVKKEYCNIKPSKVILDEEDENEEILEKIDINEIDISQNTKKLKPKINQKEDFSSFGSLSTNKTDAIPKAKSVIKQNKKKPATKKRKNASTIKINNQKNNNNLSTQKANVPKKVNNEKNYKSPKKSQKRSSKKTQNKKKSKSQNKSRNTNLNKKQYPKGINLHVKFRNPFYEEDIEISDDDDDEDFDIKSNEASKDSDYEIEINNKKRKTSYKKRKTIYKENRKNKKEDIEMKDYTTWNKLEYDSQQTILGKDYLPCREKEQKIIYNYIQEGLQTNGNYNSLYIAGMPGTGKTACVKNVINIIESEYKKNNENQYQKKSKPFTKLFICGTEFPTVSNIYKTIYKFIFSNTKGKNTKKCIQLLNNFFSNRKIDNIAHLNDPSNSHIILVIDEIDFLINRNQNILYNIFNWTTYEESKLIVISISNTLDFPNRLSPKIKSRMGNNKIMFKPYNKGELITILESKGIEFENFSKDAIKLSCMKVAAINGDLRRIIQILTRAKEIYDLDAKKNKDNKIDKNYILRACDELFNSKLIKVFQSLQISEKIIICSILSSIKDINDNKIEISKLYDKKDIFIDKYNDSQEVNKLYIYWDEYQKIIYNLARIELIFFCDKNINNIMENSISIKFYTDEFVKACNEDEELKPVLDYLTTIISI